MKTHAWISILALAVALPVTAAAQPPAGDADRHAFGRRECTVSVSQRDGDIIGAGVGGNEIMIAVPIKVSNRDRLRIGTDIEKSDGL